MILKNKKFKIKREYNGIRHGIINYEKKWNLSIIYSI